jgi:hypothetical protein
LRISELVKHIRVKPLPRLTELPWGASVGIFTLAVILSLGIFTGIQDIMNRNVESPALEAAGPAGIGIIPVDIVERRVIKKEGDTDMLSNGKVTIFSAITALIALLSGNAMGQTEWTKYEGMPVLDVSSSGWDSLSLFSTPV